MRRIIVLEHISLDGVIQAPGDSNEDSSGGFAYGGWTSPFSDEVLETWLTSKMKLPFDLLLGRATYEIWEPYWPKHGDIWPRVNVATKYVVSNTLSSVEWKPSVLVKGDIADEVAKIKQQPGPDLNVWGSGNLLQTLIRHDLVDAFWLMIYPITLGNGKRLFAGGAIPMAFRVTEGKVTPSGISIMNYERAGALPTGR
jgi:dihydrofolate reductase